VLQLHDADDGGPRGLTAASNVGHTLSATEALTGQIFLESCRSSSRSCAAAAASRDAVMPSRHRQARITWAGDRLREIKPFDQDRAGGAATPASTARCDESRSLTITGHDGGGPRRRPTVHRNRGRIRRRRAGSPCLCRAGRLTAIS